MVFRLENTSIVNEQAIDETVQHDYAEKLKLYGLTYRSSEYYWQVGDEEKSEGWIIHLSVIKSQVGNLLDLIIPQLIEQKETFKIVRDYATAGFLLDGTLGYENLGKLVCIYPNTEFAALRIALKLISITKSFRGPAIPTDFCLNGIVYTRYGPYNPDENQTSFNRIGKNANEERKDLFLGPCANAFEFLKNQKWPFESICSPTLPKRSKLLNYSYYPLVTIKKDVKGNVIKALYFKHFWQIKPCLVKQGRSCMATDQAGRDVQDRLKWQYEVYKSLAGQVPVPEIFDHFFENGDAYLTMDFINGIPLSRYINLRFKDRNWQSLSPKTKTKIIDKVIGVVDILTALHAKGFVHRDVTPENFIISSNAKMYLIDLELAWSMVSKNPNPPFKLGTPGFMSPEQEKVETPTVKEDIYALGGLITMAFTNLHPIKFHLNNLKGYRENLSFFIDDSQIVELITSCRMQNPAQRPSLSEINTSLQLYKDRIHQASLSEVQTSMPGSQTNPNKIKLIIQAGLNGLSHPNLVSYKNIWPSKMPNYDRNELMLSESWHAGMAGPLWLTSLANGIGYDLTAIKEVYTTSWSYIYNHCFTNSVNLNKGLFNGGAGIALTLAKAIESGLIPENDIAYDYLGSCFAYLADELSLANGIAGQGISLLSCRKWLNPDKTNFSLDLCVNRIIDSQNNDGSWSISGFFDKKHGIPFGLHTGVAGIVWFLLCYAEEFPNPHVKASAQRGLEWIINNSHNKKGRFNWTLSTKSKVVDLYSSDGILGITLCLIRAYKVFQVPLYKQIAETVLGRLPSHLILSDLSLDSGLAGVGEVYLEAFKVFADKAWYERADWIAGLILNTIHYQTDNKGYWAVDALNSFTADLFPGNCGILHFLMRFVEPDKIAYPLSPK